MCHVLIIEDEWLIADYLEELVRDAGATSVSVVDAQSDAIKEATDRQPALILSDVNIREGTGPRAVEQILKVLGPIPVIFVTGNPEQCVPCGPPAVILTKPVQHRVLQKTFQQLLAA